MTLQVNCTFFCFESFRWWRSRF